MTVQQTSIFSLIEEKQNGNVGKLQKIVLDIIKEKAPINNREIARIIGKDIGTIAPRTFELREKGLVVEACRELDHTTGKTTIHWKCA